MSIERLEYERDWAVCRDCETRRPVLQLCFEFRTPAPQYEISRNGVPLPVLVEGPAAPFRVCIDRTWCGAQRLRMLAPKVEKAEADLVGWLRAGRRGLRTTSTGGRKVRRR